MHTVVKEGSDVPLCTPSLRRGVTFPYAHRRSFPPGGDTRCFVVPTWGRNLVLRSRRGEMPVLCCPTWGRNLVLRSHRGEIPVLCCSHLGEKPGASFPPGGDTRCFVVPTWGRNLVLRFPPGGDTRVLRCGIAVALHMLGRLAHGRPRVGHNQAHSRKEERNEGKVRSGRSPLAAPSSAFGLKLGGDLARGTARSLAPTAQNLS
jgi:hypothetical protein